MKEKFGKIKGICKKRGILFPAAEIYGGSAGFFTYGPLGVKLKRNVKNHIREQLLDWDNIYEVSTPHILPREIWKASGHLESFTDPLVQCKDCGERHRADQLIEEKLERKAEHLSSKEMEEVLEKNEIDCPSCGGALGKVNRFQLMFKSHLGPTMEEESEAFLRPECATPAFLSFKRIKIAMRAKLPFGIAAFGTCFRNEISPRNFVFRMREFSLMDLEFMVHPKEKNAVPTEQWSALKQVVTQFLSIEHEKSEESAARMTFEDAWEKGLFETKWQALWMARIVKMLKNAGIPDEKIRFRQHMPEERSHYAADQWDCQVKFSFGWREVVGSHDRTQYDMEKHSKYSNEELTIYDHEREEKVIPYTIETSPGIDRIVYALLETSYREEGDRTYFNIPPKLAPVQITVFPLFQKDQLVKKAKSVYAEIKESYEVVYDDSGSIGKRYYRWDEVGVPFHITIDYDSLEDDTVTIRERDTTEQIRVEIKALTHKLSQLIEGEPLQEVGEIV